jgi:metal-responsive CopG/Arc/MetJ family transcriptional regulator
MKTAISVPDSVFEAAEQLAHRLGLSRSELYAKAVEEFIRAHKNQGVTEKLNEIYGQNSSSIDPELIQLQLASIPKEEW